MALNLLPETLQLQVANNFSQNAHVAHSLDSYGKIFDYQTSLIQHTDTDLIG